MIDDTGNYQKWWWFNNDGKHEYEQTSSMVDRGLLTATNNDE